MTQTVQAPRGFTVTPFGRVHVVPGRPGSVVDVEPRYENFIGGAWVPPGAGKYSSNLSPAHPAARELAGAPG